MLLKRCPENPIVTPGIYDWRKATVYNPAVILEAGRFYMLERAAASLRPHQCWLGLLESDDGVHFRHVVDEPVFTPAMMGWPLGSVQDPRVVKIDGTFYMTYAVRPFAIHFGQPPGFRLADYYDGYHGPEDNYTRSAVAISDDLVHWEHLAFCTPEGIDDRDVILFPEKIGGRFAALRRPQTGPYALRPPSIHVAYSDDLRTWSAPQFVAAPREDLAWEAGKIGGSSPPIRTEAGWLTTYHAVDADTVYRVGAMLLDLNDPARVLARTRVPILEPQTDYERLGLIIPNVVFPCGGVVRDGTLHLYYGCTDTCIAMASAPLDELVQHVLLGGGGDVALE
jgi:predicted GH43/DUF377 family glycosyl hydrolase